MSDRLQQLNKMLIPPNRVIQLRKSCKIDQSQLFNLIYPQKISKHFNEVYKLIKQDPLIFQCNGVEELTRAEQRKLGVTQALVLLKNLKINLQQDPYKFLACFYCVSFLGIGSSVKSFLHYLLYIKSILIFQSNSQHQKIIQENNKFGFENIGSFGLTELNHGSYTRGIVTEAVYDPANEEFIIDSKGEEGMKFWIGGMAETANMTIMWAQLIVDGKNYGPHPFIMRIRDPNTHFVLPGIIIGDCGPKNGNNAIDNGYMMVKNVRIPKNNLLGKLGDIDKNGKYQSEIKNNQQRFGLHMSPLSSGRAFLSFTALTQSIAALVIAIRFSCTRRQFKVDAQTQLQTLIIDYPIVRHRLMVPLASNIVYLFSGGMISCLYIQNSKNFTDPKNRVVGQLHAISAVLKSKSGWFSSKVINQCRQILGGHGYSSFSRLGVYYHDNDVNSSWEGDNNLLLQQTTKYLIKVIDGKEKTNIICLEFVKQGVKKIQETEDGLDKIQNLRQVLRNVFIERYRVLKEQMVNVGNEVAKRSKQQKVDVKSQVWNQVQPYFANELALSYGDIILFQTMYSTLKLYRGSPVNKKYLESCLKLWTQDTLQKIRYGDLGVRKVLQTLILKGCQEIYPECVGVSDVIAPPSYVIGSPFAEENGDGMRSYVTMVMTGKNQLQRVKWFQRFLELKKMQQQ